jgi:cell division protein ZapE
MVRGRRRGHYQGVAGTEHLVDRAPALGARELLARFVPPRRFSGVRFSTYRPDTAHPSQAAAKEAMEAFAATMVPADPGRRWGRRRRVAAEPDSPGRYLDGGYGVGKTHLLAALWHAAEVPAQYLSFEELTATVGFLGMETAVSAFSTARLLCIDEFELDDVANTLLAVSFLRGVIANGVRVAATSNALPDRLGQGRFNADEFTREIAAIAVHFRTVPIDGPDYRKRSGVEAATLDDDRLAALAESAEGRVAVDGFDDLLAHLRRIHPVQFAALLDGLDAVFIRGLHPIENQGSALLFVQLVDELYDAEITVAASGCAVGELFPPSYRGGGYRKKYGRAESRLAAMLLEATTA